MSNKKNNDTSLTTDNQVLTLGLVFIMLLCAILWSFSASISQPGGSEGKAAQGSGEPGQEIFGKSVV